MSKIIEIIRAINDPFIAWCENEEDICDAVLYRIRSKYSDELLALTGTSPEAPEPKKDFICGGSGGDSYGYLIFEDGSLYCYSNGDPEVWADAQDFVSEHSDIDLSECSDEEKEFFKEYGRSLYYYSNGDPEVG